MPLFRELARRLDLHVFYTHRITPEDQARAGFGVQFEWDVDLVSGYSHEYLVNVAARPNLEDFSGSDTPSIKHKLRDGRFDAVLVMGWHLKAFIQAIWGAKRAGVPLLVRGDSQLNTPRNVLKRGAKAAIYPPALRVFDAALYVGERSRSYWEHYGYPGNRMFFSPHCVDNAWFEAGATRQARLDLRSRYAIPESARVVLFAGKLVDFKRPLDVIFGAAAAASVGRPLTVMIAGAGPLDAEVRAAAQQEGVPLISLGFRNQTTMPSVYAASDVLVLPSDGRETWGLVANEALACGTPVILSDACGSAADLTVHGLAGRSYPSGDTAALGAASGERSGP